MSWNGVNGRNNWNKAKSMDNWNNADGRIIWNWGRRIEAGKIRWMI